LALVENRELLNMAKVGRASTPLDLMTYQPEDEQPSIFFLREDQREAILTVFNWTNTVRSHTLTLTDLGLPAGHTFAATDVLNQNETVTLVGGGEPATPVGEGDQADRQQYCRGCPNRDGAGAGSGKYR
jgi:hypothetical protein